MKTISRKMTQVEYNRKARRIRKALELLADTRDALSILNDVHFQLSGYSLTRILEVRESLLDDSKNLREQYPELDREYQSTVTR